MLYTLLFCQTVFFSTTIHRYTMQTIVKRIVSFSSSFNFSLLNASFEFFTSLFYDLGSY